MAPSCPMCGAAVGSFLFETEVSASPQRSSKVTSLCPSNAARTNTVFPSVSSIEKLTLFPRGLGVPHLKPGLSPPLHFRE